MFLAGNFIDSPVYRGMGQSRAEAPPQRLRLESLLK